MQEADLYLALLFLPGPGNPTSLPSLNDRLLPSLLTKSRNREPDFSISFSPYIVYEYIPSMSIPGAAVLTPRDKPDKAFSALGGPAFHLKDEEKCS